MTIYDKDNDTNDNMILLNIQGEKGGTERVNLVEYNEDDLLRAFRKESYCLGNAKNSIFQNILNWLFDKKKP